MRYQVPQFVDIEDQIIGPLTLKQFLMYVVAVMVLVPVYLLSDLSLFITIMIPVLGVAAAFAHLKINGKSLFFTINAAIEFFLKGQLYIWQRTSKLHVLKLQDKQWQELLAARASATQERSSLTAIAKNLETNGNVSSVDAEDPLEVAAL